MHPNLSSSIHPFPPPPTHKKYWNACKYIVANIIHFFGHGKPSPTSPTAKLSQSKPTGTPCLIGKDGLLKRIVVCSPARPWSHSGAKISQIGSQYMVPSQIQHFLPQSAPQRGQRRAQHLMTTLGIVDACLLVPPTPAQQPHYSALPSGTPGR